MKYSALLLAALGLASASERYIIEYDQVAWETLSLKSLPTNTKYILKELRMQVADLDADEIKSLESLPGVQVHKDGPVHLLGFRPNGVQDNVPSWGIDRLDQRALPLDKKYHWDLDGKGVDVWIVDTGVYPDHQEFEGRAKFEKNFAEDGIDRDCHGHGTHVASTIAGAKVGVAKGATVHGVKVLDCGGSGSWSGVIAGINHVATEHKKIQARKSVINMSLGGGKNAALNAAVAAATKAGVVVVVAAGNESDDACYTSPASAPEAITVAASDKTDASAYFTNYGKCVDLYAPGVDIYAAVIGGKDKYETMSGTSMASPHTAGAVALLLGSGKASNPEEVRKLLIENGTKDVISDIPDDTPNVLLNTWDGEKKMSDFFNF